MDRVVFSDRDGTINQEVYYLHKPEDLVPFPGVPEATRALREAGPRIVVVTDRAGVARGYYTCQEVGHLYVYLNELLEKGGAHIDYSLYCPRRLERGIGEYKIERNRRKSETGMLKMVEQYYQTDKAHSHVIGDKLLDVEAGRNYGVHSILVSTRYGAAIYREQEASVYDFYAETLMGATRYIINREQ